MVEEEIKIKMDDCVDTSLASEEIDLFIFFAPAHLDKAGVSHCLHSVMTVSLGDESVLLFCLRDIMTALMASSPSRRDDLPG